jgi:leucyl-tRNA synthetase
MNWVVVKKFIYTIVIMLAPVASHTCEYIWSDVLKVFDRIILIIFNDK